MPSHRRNIREQHDAPDPFSPLRQDRPTSRAELGSGRRAATTLPMPPEHGAWVMLFAPLAIGLAVGPPPPPAPALLLVIAAAGALLLQNTTGFVLRGRAQGRTVWLAIYLSLFCASVLPLLLVYHLTALLTLGIPAAALLAMRLALLLIPARKRLDRSLWGEVLGVPALTLTAPAAYIVSGGALDGEAWCLWAATTIYFASGIFVVKMLLAAARSKAPLDWPARLRVGRDHLIYHALLIVALGFVATTLPRRAALLAVLAYVPALYRALLSWIRLSNRLPNLTRVGFGELLYALWFVGLFIAALHV